MANNTTKNGVYVPSILMQKFRGKGPQNAGNGISGCLDLKIFRGRMPPTNAIFFTRHRSKKTLDPRLFRNENDIRLKNDLILQGSFVSVIDNSTLSFNSLWSSVQSRLPKNIFNFTVRYINNSLPTRKNLMKWGLSSSADCSFCCSPESLMHIISGCKTCLNERRCTW